jgi:MFS family permease
MNRLALTIGLAAMDLCWVYPWSVLLGLWSGGAPRPLVSAPYVFGLIVLGAIASQALGRVAVTRRSLRLALAGVGGAAAAGAVRMDHYPGGGIVDWLGPFAAALAAVIGQVSAPVLAFGVALYLWWRGLRLGAQWPGYADVEGAFRWGIGLLITFALIMAVTTRPSVLAPLEAETTPFVVGFFFASLLTLALGRLESLRTRTRALALNTQWFSVLVAVAGLIVLVALVLGQLVSFNLLIVATRPLFDLLGTVVLLLLYAIVIPLAYVLEWLIYLILSLIHLNVDQQPPQPPQPSDVDDLLQRLVAQVLTPEMVVALKAVGAAALLLVALVVVSRAVKRWRPSSVDAAVANEERDSVFAAELVLRAVRAWLRRLLRRTGASADGPGKQATDLGAVASEQPLSVRALYRRVLRLGESVGARRALATTPLEHLPILQASLDPPEGLSELTAAYVQARYAEANHTPDEIAELGAGVDRLRAKFGPE